MCIGKLTIISSDNGLSPSQCQAIHWTNAGLLLIWTLGTNFSKIIIEIHTFPFKKMHLKMSSGKCRPSCLGLNMRQSGRYLPDNILECILLNENVCILIEILLKFVPNGPINNIPALDEKMDWHQPGNRPLSEPMMASFTDTFMCHSAWIINLAFWEYPGLSTKRASNDLCVS